MSTYRVSLLIKSLAGGPPQVANHFGCDTKAEAAKHGEDWVAADRESRSYSIDDVEGAEEAETAG